MIKNKKGITMISIIIYVVLFFVFTIAVTVISNNFNNKLFTDRGYSININSFNKLQYNLLVSSKNSNIVNTTDNEINFSNNDNYIYDSEKKIITKNGGFLVSNVISYYLTQDNGEDGTLLNINIKFQKYLHKDLIDRQIKVFVEKE